MAKKPSKPSQQDLEKIVQQKFPHMKIAKQSAAPPREVARPDAQLPNDEVIRTKYHHNHVASADESAPTAGDDADQDITSVEVVPDTQSEDATNVTPGRLVFISKSTGKVIGMEG